MATTEIHITELECVKCGHHWYPQKPRRPAQCPACRNPYWDDEEMKRRNTKNNRCEPVEARC